MSPGVNLPDEDILDLHRRLVEMPSVSHAEDDIADLLANFLGDHGVQVERIERNVIACSGDRPRLVYNSHLDTVPPSDRWTRDPWRASREKGRIYGLGSNDAKAAVTGMAAAFLCTLGTDLEGELAVAFVADEETGGRGTELIWPMLRERGWQPDAVVIGEPTGLNPAVAQKGMLILELETEGTACHAAHAGTLKATNAVRELARDLVALEEIDLGPEHDQLGRTTMEPTVTGGGRVRNMIPERASSVLDLRTVPGEKHSRLVDRVRERVGGRVKVISERLQPRECPSDAAILAAIETVRPQGRRFGSATMSDWALLDDVCAVKCGPGATERSHTPDEWIGVDEILAGAEFYGSLARVFLSGEMK